MSEYGLQCGHGDVAVENNTDVDEIARENMLQCGHGDVAVENIARIRPA